ncbi:hypothetical protein ACA910_001278 [Epithemia clementina (nom. ined.)]
MLGSDDDDDSSNAAVNAVGESSATTTAAYRQELKRKEEEVAILQDRVHSLSAQLEAALSQNSSRGSSFYGYNNHHASNTNNNPFSKKKKRRHLPLSPHAMNVREEVNGDRTHNHIISAQRERLGRNASIATRQALDQLELQQQQEMEAANDMFNHTRSSSWTSHNYAPPSSSSRQQQQQQSSAANPPPIQRIIDMFQRPSQHLDYLNSQQFAKDLYKVTIRVRNLLETEPRVVFLQSPAYVFGDIHGNLEDLHFFSDNLWRLGLSLTAGNFLFLGDYVDRGKQCLECLAYLFALKLQNPHKLFLLRGNHETRDVNGWEEHYGDRSFIYQCRARFGDDIGYRIWEICNQAFDRLPLAAVIDQDIFCVHGGIPRPVHNNHTTSTTTATSSSDNLLLATAAGEGGAEEEAMAGGGGGGGSTTAMPTTMTTTTTRIQDILTVPKVAGINPPYEHEDEKYQQVASDCIWSDPASEEQELTTVDPVTGYGESLRGGGAICFGHKAVTQFLEQVDCSYIMRAHEAHAEGVAVSKGARVFTVFSTSQDHNQGSHAMAGCILVDNDKLQVINRSPAYKNQYVHRRDSVSLAHVSEPEIQKRIRLGLVKEDSSAQLVNHHNQHNDTIVATDQVDPVAVDEEVLQQQREETWRDFDDTSSDNGEDDEDVEDVDDDARRSSPGHVSGNSLTPRRESSGVILDVGMGGDYVFDKTRRSSVDLTTLNLPAASAMSDEKMEPAAPASSSSSSHQANTHVSLGGLFGEWASSTVALSSNKAPTTTATNPFEWARAASNGYNNNSSNIINNNSGSSPFFFTAGTTNSAGGDTPMTMMPPAPASVPTPFATIDENHVVGENGSRRKNTSSSSSDGEDDDYEEVDTVIDAAGGDSDDVME